MKKKFTVALLGRTEWLLRTGKLLHQNGFEIKLIITSKNAEWDPITPKDIEYAKKNRDKINKYQRDRRLEKKNKK